MSLCFWFVYLFMSLFLSLYFCSTIFPSLYIPFSLSFCYTVSLYLCIPVSIVQSLHPFSLNHFSFCLFVPLSFFLYCSVSTSFFFPSLFILSLCPFVFLCLLFSLYILFLSNIYPLNFCLSLSFSFSIFLQIEGTSLPAEHIQLKHIILDFN